MSENKEECEIVERTEEERKILLENQDQREDAQRRMAWTSLAGMMLYPVAVVVATLFNLPQAAEILGDMAATYFVSVAAIVAAFFGKEAYIARKNLDREERHGRRGVK